MIRTLLATTALAAVLAVPAIAQDSSSSMMDSSMMSSEMMSSEMMSSETPMDSSSSVMDSMSSESPMDMSSSMMISSEAPMDTMTSSEYVPFDITTGYAQIDTDRLASRIIGQPVYDGTAADANNLGNINDLVLDANGDVAAVVVGRDLVLRAAQRRATDDRHEQRSAVDPARNRL